MLNKYHKLDTFVIKSWQRHRNRVPALFSTRKLNYCSEKSLSRHCPLVTEEIRIKTPSGHIAGKLWNIEGKRTPILACHGWFDNAGTWDHLCPYLDANFPVLAIDFPGHGWSSPKPFGIAGLVFDYAPSIERIIKNFKWKKVILLGHSMGGSVGMVYSATFPSKVEKLIMIDVLKPIHIDVENFPARTALGIQELLEAEEKQLADPPRYSYSEILAKTIAAYEPSLSEKSAMTLLKRGSQKHDNNTYSYAHSPLIKVFNIQSLTLDLQKSFASKVKCDLLAIKFEGAPLYAKKEIFREFMNIYRKNSSNFIFDVVPGTHHAHLNNPEDVAPLINDFLNDIPQDKGRKLNSDKFVKLTC